MTCPRHIVAMALDSDDEWLRELLAPEPLKRRRVSDDDADAAQFLNELLSSGGSASRATPSCPVAPAQLVIAPTQRIGPFVLAPVLPARFGLPAARAPSRLTTPAAHPVDGHGKSARPPRVQQQVQPSKVAFRLPQSTNAGAILAHAARIVQETVERGPTIFKIGITVDPVHRWGNQKYGYQHDRDRYQQMLVFAEADSAGAAMLEASLINMFKQTSGCRNTAPGGESVKPGCAVFTYIVYRNFNDDEPLQGLIGSAARMGA